MARLIKMFSVMVFVFILYGCEKESKTPLSPSKQIHITKVSGDNQEVQEGQKISHPLKVMVTDGYGHPIQDIRVDWEPIRVEGLTKTSNLTDLNGEAQWPFEGEWVKLWGEGQIKVKATAFGSGESVTFTIIIVE